MDPRDTSSAYRSGLSGGKQPAHPLIQKRLQYFKACLHSIRSFYHSGIQPVWVIYCDTYLFTGPYPPRTAVTRVLFPQNDVGLNVEEVTIADVLKQRGYATAAIGKWHLGHLPEFLPTRHGFDFYWSVPYSNDMWLDPRLPLAADVILHDGVTREWIQEGAPDDKRRKGDIPLMINE